MAMILDAFMSRCCTLLTSFVEEEVIMVLGVKAELQKLQQRMVSIQKLLQDAENRKFDDSSIDHWLSELKDVMYDADDVIDLCRIEGAQLLADQNSKSKASPLCINFPFAFSCFTSIPLHHEIGNKIKNLNSRLSQIDENRKQFKLEHFARSESQITQVDSRQTSSMVDDVIVGREVDVAANELVERLLAEKVEEKCRLFAVTGMGGIGKTILAQKIFNHPKIQTFFNLKVWTCVSQTYSETELLQQVIRGAKGSYENAKTKSELQPFLRDAVVSGKSLFLVLDDVWRADVWVDLLRVPLQSSMMSVRILVTTRYEDVAKDMKAAYVHPVLHLSIESSWEMLRKRLFLEEEEELANSLKGLGYMIVEKCDGLPLAIKVIAGVLARKERSKKVWEKVLLNDAWSISQLPDELKGALYLSFEDLSSHLKQCFLYCSLYPEDAKLDRRDLARLWVAEGFVTEQHDSIMEDLAEEYFNELVKRNLLLPDPFSIVGDTGKMHDIVRSLALFLSKEESSSSGNAAGKYSTKGAKIRRLSVKDEASATEILDSVIAQGALRTLIASGANLLLDDERLRQLSHLRVLQIRKTPIQVLPNSIGNLVHLRFLDMDGTHITAIPESIERLANLQFLNIRGCRYLTELPSGITRLYNLRRLGLFNTPLNFIPKGIGKLQLLNDLSGFVVAMNDSSSKLEELNCLKQIRMLSICKLEKAQTAAIVLRELPYLSDLKLFFTEFEDSEPRFEEQQSIENLFDELIPPRSLEELKIKGFSGGRFPNWMALSSFENCVPFLTRLELGNISSCTQLPPLGQLPELRLLVIKNASSVKRIGEEFLGGGVNSSTRTAFPKLELLRIHDMPELEEWTFGAEIEQDASPRLKLMPCLQELSISECPLLEELPHGLKHSAMKSLCVEKADCLISIEDLPHETELLRIEDNEILEKICCLSWLKRLEVIFCKSLLCVEKLDSLQELTIFDFGMESLPEWLLMLLREWEVLSDSNKDFLLQLQCTEKALRECVEGGSHWDIIRGIPRVIAYDFFGSGYLRYCKQPFVYDTNL